MAAAPMLTAASLSFSALPVPRLRAAPPASSFAPPRRVAAAPVVRAAAASSKSPAEAAPSAPKKKRATGITLPKPVSPALQAIVGAPEIPRTEALKRLWAYIKQHNLQDPADKKVVVCDEKLKVLFAGRERVGFLDIAKLLNPHFVK
ncbi:upstream activation factor subunit UAF30-like [Phragmites australis]|uniref:upstream activation factor subunit UAF30-like n=1 Tax=Phragmites australis TaxID=29695 RepID=UPI002D76CBFB|nr:upstream activation factor subunit UAF30-like [Phragmites australis]